MRTFLAAYTIRVVKNKERGEKENQSPQYCTLSSFDGHNDFRNVMENFLNHLKINIKNEIYKTYMKVLRIENEGRSICGILESGIYGLSSNIRDVDTDSIAHKKKKNHADVLPFYLLAYIPEDTDEGILILQRTGKYGIRSNFGSSIEKYFSAHYRGFTVEINTLLQEEIIKKILYSGTIKKLRCVKYQAPVDSFDGLDDGHNETSYNMEVVLSANRIPVMEKIKSFFDLKENVRSLIELRDFNFSYDTVKVEVEVDGSLRTFDLGHLNRTRTYFDISDSTRLDADDHPVFESIHEITKCYLNEMIEQMYPSLR